MLSQLLRKNKKSPAHGARVASGSGGQDLLCFDFVTEIIKGARVKGAAGSLVTSDLFYKNVQGAARQDIVAAIREMAQRGGRIKNPKVILTLPVHLAITRNIEIPSQDPKEIKDIISLQSGRLTPYSREEVIIEHIRIGVFRQSYTKLLLLIVTKDTVNKQIALFSEAGLAVDKVVVYPEAMGALIHDYYRLEIKDSPFSVIHVDASHTDFVVYVSEKLAFVRSIAIGARHLLLEKEKHLERFLEELKKSLDAYTAEDIEANPCLAVLTGACDGLRDLEVLMLDVFRLPVKTLSVSDLVARSSYLSKEALAPKDYSYLNVTAAVFKSQTFSVNLLPEEIKVRKSLEERGRDIIKTGVLAMVLLVCVFSALLVDMYIKTEYVNRLSGRYQDLIQQAGQVESDLSRIRMVRSFLDKRGNPTRVLAELHALTPPEVALNNIRLRETGDLSVKGEAVSMGDVFTYVASLEKSQLFKEVKTKYTAKRKAEERELVDFEITGLVEFNPKDMT